MAEVGQMDTPEQAEFRQSARAWLEDNRPADPIVRLPLTPLEIMTEGQLSYLQAWQKAAYDAGLVGCDYPVEMGGGGKNDCQRIANEEMKKDWHAKDGLLAYEGHGDNIVTENKYGNFEKS